MTFDPHANQPVLKAGLPLEQAKAAMLMVHGRGASAEDILTLAAELDSDDLFAARSSMGFAYLAPQAASQTWYPQRFMSPLEQNEPWLSSALLAIDRTFRSILASGISNERVVLLGFSQGACLALEYAARNARRYGGTVGLSGGLIGPVLQPERYLGDFSGTTVFLGCSDVDPHVPLQRISESSSQFERMGADVIVRIYPGMDHTVNDDELDIVRNMMVKVAG
jgi:predicted esterase